jgi:hypothetical protein
MRWTAAGSSVRVRASMVSTRLLGSEVVGDDEAALAQHRAREDASAARAAREHDQDAATSRLQERVPLGRRRHARRQ